VISNAFACDRTSKAADYATLQVVTDSCGDLRFVLRELAYCIEDDRGSFNQPVDEPSSCSKYCEQSLSNVWVVLLSPEYVGVKSDRKSVDQRNLVSGSEAACPYCSLLIQVMSQ
jgi:hypothetical protein